MARSRSSYLNELSTADLKQLLAARERIDVLEKEKARLEKDLGAVDAELKRLVAGVEKPAAGAASRKKVTRKKTARKKAAGKTVAGKKTTRKKVTRKVAAKPAAGKKTTKKKVAGKAAPAAKKTATRKKTSKKATGKKAKVQKAAPTLEDIVVGIIKAAGQPVSYQDIMAAIRQGKLFTSRSKNFDNVLRRTLSTSKKVKRAGRGIYTTV
jgi:hypothetical protein